MGPAPTPMAPAAPPKPAMNPPPQMAQYGGYGGPPQQQQQQQMGGMMNGGGYGGPPPGQQMGMGGPPPIGGQMGMPGGFQQQPPPQQMMGGPMNGGGSMRGPGMMGAPPQMNGGGMMQGGPPQGGPPAFQGGGMLVPAAQQSNPYANMLGGPPPPQPGQQPGQWGQQPPPGQMGGPPPPPPQQMAPSPNLRAPPAPANVDPFGGGVGQAPPTSNLGPPANNGQFGGQAPGPAQPDPIASAWGAPPPAGPPAQAPPPGGNFDIFGAPQPNQMAPPPGPQRQSSQQFGGPLPQQHGGPPPQQHGGPPPPQQQQQPAPDGGFGGLFDPNPASAPPAADPWGPGPPAPVQSQALVPAAGAGDPWGDIFGSPQPAAPVPPPQRQPSAQGGDFYGGGGSNYREEDATTVGGGDTITGMGNHAPKTSAPALPSEPADYYSGGGQGDQQNSSSNLPSGNQGELPEGGEFFDARIFTPTLGVMFFKPQELKDSLFLQTDPEMVDMLEERPVVAFIVEGSSARCAGVELGNVLLKVNGISVKNPKEASRLIKEGPRPLPLLFYVPNTTVVVAEGEHMVKYDTRETGAPLSAKDWKPKYVVIGGIIAQPSMMNMYRSKAEYDIAVIETQARRPVSVKVKQFSLQGARVQNDWQGPQMVKYKNKLHPWKFIVVLPVSRNPIKISSTNLSQLKPVHEGIRRVLMAQQRGSSAHIQGPTAAPIKHDPYAPRGSQNYTPSAREGGVGSGRRKNMDS